MIDIYTADDAARMPCCSVKTVEDMARRGALPGIKPGGEWVFPAGALAHRLNEMADEQAAERRKPVAPLATTASHSAAGKTGKRGRRTLPRLVTIEDGA